MTEQEWLACTEPTPMLDTFGERPVIGNFACLRWLAVGESRIFWCMT